MNQLTINQLLEKLTPMLGATPITAEILISILNRIQQDNTDKEAQTAINRINYPMD